MSSGARIPQACAAASFQKQLSMGFMEKIISKNQEEQDMAHTHDHPHTHKHITIWRIC